MNLKEVQLECILNTPIVQLSSLGQIPLEEVVEIQQLDQDIESPYVYPESYWPEDMFNPDNNRWGTSNNTYKNAATFLLALHPAGRGVRILRPIARLTGAWKLLTDN
jgi:hypothetical protein